MSSIFRTHTKKFVWENKRLFQTCSRFCKFNEPLSGHEMPRAGGIASMMRLPVKSTAEGNPLQLHQDRDIYLFINARAQFTLSLTVRHKSCNSYQRQFKLFTLSVSVSFLLSNQNFQDYLVIVGHSSHIMKHLIVHVSSCMNLY